MLGLFQFKEGVQEFDGLYIGVVEELALGDFLDSGSLEGVRAEGSFEELNIVKVPVGIGGTGTSCTG